MNDTVPGTTTTAPRRTSSCASITEPQARDYLLQDLLLSGNLKRFGYVTGVGLAPPDAPRYKYTRDPYFTDGLRAVADALASDQRRERFVTN